MNATPLIARTPAPLSLTERELKAFIDATLCFFEKITQEPAEIGDAVIHFNNAPTLDFTGVIQISGSCSGFVYVTLPRKMLSRMMESVGEMDADDEACLDFAGEIANTVSSNAREIFGSSFCVSAPAPLDASAAKCLIYSNSSFVLPVTWRGSSAFIVIALQQN